jgi:hypothetical protein
MVNITCGRWSSWDNRSKPLPRGDAVPETVAFGKEQRPQVPGDPAGRGLSAGGGGGALAGLRSMLEHNFSPGAGGRILGGAQLIEREDFGDGDDQQAAGRRL